MKVLSTILLLSFSLLLSAQDCEEGCYKKVTKEEIKYTDGSKGLYTGCVDKFDKFSGFGEIKINGLIQYKGCYKLDQRHGQGTYTSYDSQNRKEWTYEGNWENGQQHGQGIIIFYENGKEIQIYDGNWKNGQENGQGIYTYVNSNKIWTGIYNQGQMTKDGYWNYENHYDPDDIIFPSSSSERVSIDLEKHPDHEKVYIDLNFGNNTEIFLFDTGASGITMSTQLYNQLKNKGINFYDLRVNGQSSVADQRTVNHKYYKVDFSIYNINLKNVVILVGDNLSNLFGLDFFKKFSDYNFCLYSNKGEMILYK